MEYCCLFKYQLWSSPSSLNKIITTFHDKWHQCPGYNTWSSQVPWDTGPSLTLDNKKKTLLCNDLMNCCSQRFVFYLHSLQTFMMRTRNVVAKIRPRHYLSGLSPCWLVTHWWKWETFQTDCLQLAWRRMWLNTEIWTAEIKLVFTLLSSSDSKLSLS